MPENYTRIEQLTFTRFIAAIAVVIYHFGQRSFFLTNRFLHPLFANGNIAVDYFFILSGFVLMIVYGQNKQLDKRKFYVNRFARIYPVYLIGLLLVIGQNFYIGKAVDPAAAVLGFFCLQSWVSPYPLSLNNPGWSLSVEVLFYALAPFLFITYSKYSFKKVAVFIIACWVAGVLLVQFLMAYCYTGFPSKSHDLILYFPPMHLHEFMIGTLTGICYLKIKRPNINTLGTVLILLLLCVLYLLFKYPLHLKYQNDILAGLFVPFIYLLSINTGPVARLMSRKIPVYLGEISYSIYILHLPVYVWMMALLKRAGMHFNLYVYLILLIAVCMFSYRFIELPLKKAITQYGKRAALKYNV